MQERDFFKPEHLNPYRSDPRIIRALGGGSLLNHSEFMNWYELPDPRMSARNIGKKNRASEIADGRVKVMESLTQIANSVCENKIDYQYGISAILNLSFDRYDILAAVAPGYDKVKRDETSTTPSVSLKNKTKHILGFVIVEKGECKMKPDDYTINLICSRSKLEYKKYGLRRIAKRERLRAAILLGAYMYCAKKRDQDIGLLELADGYNNISGFFSYSKMGFVKDLSLFGRRCFRDYANLPMSVRLDRYTYDNIIDYASGEQKLENIQDDTGLIRLIPRGPRQQDIQKTFAIFCNLSYQMVYIVNHEHNLDPAIDKMEISILMEFVDEMLNRNPDQDITLEQYMNYINTNKQYLLDAFHAHSPDSGPTKRNREDATNVTRSNSRSK